MKIVPEVCNTVLNVVHSPLNYTPASAEIVSAHVARILTLKALKYFIQTKKPKVFLIRNHRKMS